MGLRGRILVGPRSTFTECYRANDVLTKSGLSFTSVMGNFYSGLWYPIEVPGMTLVVGLLFIPETKDRDIYAED